MAIQNDRDFKAALTALEVPQQRALAAQFVRRVQGLSGDPRVLTAVELAARAAFGTVTEAELALAAQAANTARVESFTQCGKETDWTAQAGHFVAKAAVACVRPAAEAAKNTESLAWDAAMQARMARTCQTVAEGSGTDNPEAIEQYRLLEALLNS